MQCALVPVPCTSFLPPSGLDAISLSQAPLLDGLALLCLDDAGQEVAVLDPLAQALVSQRVHGQQHILHLCHTLSAVVQLVVGQVLQREERQLVQREHLAQLALLVQLQPPTATTHPHT